MSEERQDPRAAELPPTKAPYQRMKLTELGSLGTLVRGAPIPTSPDAAGWRS